MILGSKEFPFPPRRLTDSCHAKCVCVGTEKAACSYVLQTIPIPGRLLFYLKNLPGGFSADLQVFLLVPSKGFSTKICKNIEKMGVPVYSLTDFSDT